VVGTVTSSAVGSSGAPIAIAYVRREIEPPVNVELRWDGGGGEARVELLR
jgi:hypothetical protein